MTICSLLSFNFEDEQEFHKLFNTFQDYISKDQLMNESETPISHYFKIKIAADVAN